MMTTGGSKEQLKMGTPQAMPNTCCVAETSHAKSSRYRDPFMFSSQVRWDADHVLIRNDEFQVFAQELVRENNLTRAHIGLVFFYASINRIAA